MLQPGIWITKTHCYICYIVRSLQANSGRDPKFRLHEILKIHFKDALREKKNIFDTNTFNNPYSHVEVQNCNWARTQTQCFLYRATIKDMMKFNASGWYSVTSQEISLVFLSRQIFWNPRTFVLSGAYVQILTPLTISERNLEKQEIVWHFANYTFLLLLSYFSIFFLAYS